MNQMNPNKNEFQKLPAKQMKQCNLLAQQSSASAFGIPASLNNYFLPYQLRWLDDKSPIKIWEKSRRIGATYVQSYEDVTDCVNKNIPSVWFSSADESAAREYIAYCEQWTKMLKIAAKYYGSIILNKEEDIKAFVIEFANGTRINALSSNPKAFRSKGGKVVLDEFAHHDNQDALWAAAKPCITWGFPMRILSTHNGQNCRFFKFIEQIKNDKNNWSLHTTPLQLAVDEGLVEKIFGRAVTEEEKRQWIKEQRMDCFDEYTWLQEYCCIAIDESVAFLPYDLIATCESEGLLTDLSKLTGDVYVGMDIGRKKDLTVIWVIEKLGNVNYTRKIEILEKTPFKIQEEILENILKHKNLRRCCIDSTGLGMQMAENFQLKFGKYRVEPITFTNRVKEDLAYNLRTHFENKTVYIPSEHEIREDLHSIRKVSTLAGNIRFDVQKSDINGHADRFWALALALHAAQAKPWPIHIATRCRRESIEMTDGLFDGFDWDSY